MVLESAFRVGFNVRIYVYGQRLFAIRDPRASDSPTVNVHRSTGPSRSGDPVSVSNPKYIAR